jgi:tetratricopeptide (TPR) repeat protein
MIQKPNRNRVVTAFRLAFYPAFEPATEKHFEALTMDAENARSSGDLVKAEELYLRAMAEARASSDSSHLNQARYGLAQLYQEQRRYRKAEHIFRDQLEEAINSAQPNTQVHAGHMSLALLYQDEGNSAEAEKHYKAAVAETEKTELWSGRQFYCSNAMRLARFYVTQHRYEEAESLFHRALEIYEEDRRPNYSLSRHLADFAKIYEAQEKYYAAEELYRRALKICEELGTDTGFNVRALDDLAGFCRARGRYAEAEDLYRRSLAIVEEKVPSQATLWTKGWRRWRNRKESEAMIRRNQIPISLALDKLAEVYEYQQKYAEAEPLRRRSLEINERAWGEEHSRAWVDSLAAYANVLHKIGRQDEAAGIDDRVESIRAKYPQGSVNCVLFGMSMPVRRNLRWRFSAFVNAILHPSVR